MTDCELLELAAKAAGMDGATYQGPEDWFEIRYDMTQAMYHDSTGYWNPLEDDGDALRLAVKLRLTVYTFGDHAAGAVLPSNQGSAVSRVALDGDWTAATRRAIVRAATLAKDTHA